LETATRETGRRLFLLRQFQILQRHPRREQLRPPFPSSSFISAFGVPSTSPVTEAVAMIGSIKWLMLEKCSIERACSSPWRSDTRASNYPVFKGPANL
jgi:hypothetical protein